MDREAPRVLDTEDLVVLVEVPSDFRFPFDLGESGIIAGPVYPIV